LGVGGPRRAEKEANEEDTVGGDFTDQNITPELQCSMYIN